LPIFKETLDEIALSEKEYQFENVGTDLKVCPYTTGVGYKR